MSLRTTNRALLAVIVVLLAVIAGGIAYVVPMRWEVGRLRSELARRPEAAPVERAVGDRSLTELQRSTMLEELGGVPAGQGKVWFTRSPGDAEAAAFQRDLRGVFEEAGWSVEGSTEASFTLRPGVYFLSADETPPAYVDAAQAALRFAGIEMSVGSGYRAFYEEKKAADPRWRGFPFAPDQAYLIAIGRAPSS